MLRRLALTAAFIALSTCALAEVAKPPDATAPLVLETDPILSGAPPFRRQFLDPMVMEESGGLERVFHQAEKYKGNPVLVEEKPWERDGPKLGSGSVVRVGDKLRMYYCSKPVKGGGAAAMAESTDGIHWTRPNLGLVEYNGSKDNNVIAGGAGFKVSNPSSPDRKWVSCSAGGISYSADGLIYTRDTSVGPLFTAGDVVIPFYDPYKHRMAATWKVMSRRHRSVGVVWATSDITKWEKPVNGPVFAPDGLDPDDTQIYGMPVFAYQGMYIGLPMIYHARWIKYGKYTDPDVMFEAQTGSSRKIDTQLAWSWDLITWSRTPKREPFVPNGPAKSYDYGMILTWPPIVMGDEMWFYYTGYIQIHDVKGGATVAAIAKLRLDGFCSMHAASDEGWLISRREVFNTPKVTINAKCAPGGYVTAELVDRYNSAIPGFERDNCIPFKGDSVRGELTWKTSQFPEELADKDKKVKFYIKNADLYSYLPTDINQKIDDGWPD